MMKSIYLVVLAIFIVATFSSCEVRESNTLSSISVRGEEGLAAHYNFDEGSGSIAKDISGNGNDGKINGAKFVKLKEGYALKFDGADDYVDCGKGPSLDITNAITVEAWVYLTGVPTVPSAWIIAGKGPTTYSLSYHASGSGRWYIGANNVCQSEVSIEQWHHLAGTFDGKTTALYVDGELRLSKASKYPTIASRRDIALGIGGAPFSGMIDDVKIYRRALAAVEIEKHYQAEKAAKLARMSRVRDGKRLAGDGFSLKVGQRGGMQLDVGQDSYFIESALSEPGETIRWNRLAEEPQAERAWELEVSKPAKNEITIRSQGTHYALERKLRLDGGKIRVTDTLTNTSGLPVGIIVQNHIIASRPFGQCLLGGMAVSSISGSAANPTVFVSQERSRLGVVAEDSVSRQQFEASAALNRATISIRHFGLAPGKSRMLEWTIYPLGAEADYFTLVNRIRNDWKSNFTMDGPFEFGAVFAKRNGGVDYLRLKFQRKPVKFVALFRFFEYNMEPMTRQEYKRHVTETMALMKEASPGVKVLASIETFSPSLLYYPDRIKGRERLNEFIKAHGPGWYTIVPAELTKFLEEANPSAPWLDSLSRTPEGLFVLYICNFKFGDQVGDCPVAAFYSFPAPGNYRHAELMDQVRFLIDEVGVDGIYFDGFAAFGGQYGQWDGITVDINPHTGKIVRQYMNALLAGTGSRMEIANYLLSRGKILVGNGGNSTTREEQSIPTFRFIENHPVLVPAGEEPPLNQRMCGLQLGSPIALMGAWGSAENIYKAVIAYLRHGLVCYFYVSNFPETGKGSGDYGLFRHMFPLTPVGLHEGWIEGKERIITCVSGSYVWKGKEKPITYLFDAVGREKPHNFAIQKTKKTWKVKVDLKDWEEIAVIESPPGE